MCTFIFSIQLHGLFLILERFYTNLLYPSDKKTLNMDDDYDDRPWDVGDRNDDVCIKQYFFLKVYIFLVYSLMLEMILKILNKCWPNAPRNFQLLTTLWNLEYFRS